MDQLGVRRLSGDDFPSSDPLAPTLRGQVERLASPEWGGRKPGTPGNAEAARYLAREMESVGILPLPSLGGYFAPLATPAGARADLGPNVIGYLPGGSAADADVDGRGGVVVLGAHYDHVGSTGKGTLLGADDNASAVAVLLGAASTLRGEPRAYPVIFVFFNTEEAPYFGTPLQGSRSFVAALPKEIGSIESIRLAVVLDLIGGVVWRPSADLIFACGAEKSPGLSAIVDGVREEGLAVRRLGIHMVENLPGYAPQAFSDYDIFRLRRVPFLFLSSGRTPRYHTPTDLPPTLYYDRMARTSRWIARLVREVDHRRVTFPFDAAGADHEADLTTMRWAIDAASLPWSSVPGTSPVTAARLLGDRARLRGMADQGHVFTREDVLSLERASFRLQCLLYAYPVCFTL